MQKGKFKMGKLSKAKSLTEAEKYCVEGMLYNGMGASEISKTLGRDEVLIEEFIKQEEEEGGGPMIINETASGSKGVTIMTEAGSYRVDEAKKKDLPKPSTETTIHKIHE